MKDTRKEEPTAKPGAPKGNRNSMRHGLKAGKLPADCKYIENRLNAIRRSIEDAVQASKGRPITVEEASYIQTAIRWESHAALAHRWLTKEGKKLSITERLYFSKEVANASANRDKAISMLDLGDQSTTVIDALYKRLG